MKQLQGKTIEAIAVNDGEDLLVVYTDKGHVAFNAWGDCCSETWFSDIYGVPFLLGATVVGVDRVDMEKYDTEDGRCRQEYDTAYGYKIRTNKGDATVVFRNSSNGYYGGDVELFAGAIPAGLRFVTEDWSA